MRPLDDQSLRRDLLAQERERFQRERQPLGGEEDALPVGIADLNIEQFHPDAREDLEARLANLDVAAQLLFDLGQDEGAKEVGIVGQEERERDDGEKQE